MNAKAMVRGVIDGSYVGVASVGVLLRPSASVRHVERESQACRETAERADSFKAVARKQHRRDEARSGVAPCDRARSSATDLDLQRREERDEVRDLRRAQLRRVTRTVASAPC